MKIKVHENYEQIDRKNIDTFQKYELSHPEENLYRCVICGEQACIGNSISCQGHRLIHNWCANKVFGYWNILEAFKWVEDQAADEIIK